MFPFLKNGQKVKEMVKTSTMTDFKKKEKKLDTNITKKEKKKEVELRVKRMEILEVLIMKEME